MGALNSRLHCNAFVQNLRSQGKLASNDSCPCGETPWYEEASLDELGCRIFPPCPPVGQHPRLLFTRDEIPFLLARLLHTHLGKEVVKGAKACYNQFKNFHRVKFENISHERRLVPSREDVERLFKPDETRNVVWFSTLVYSLVTEDEALRDQVKFELLHYAKMILLSKKIAHEEKVETGSFKVWHSNGFDLSTGQLFGGVTFALGYDLFYNDFTTDERNIYRSALASAVKGRRSWGMGWPATRIQSNWAAYHGELIALCAVIEGEEGFDQQVYDLFKQLMIHYCQYAVYDSGHPVEDSYSINLGFREGSIALLVLARRGTNLFRHPHYYKIWREWLPYALYPDRSGNIYGGSSGSAYIYPGSLVVAKYMYPGDEVVDWVYRHYMCANGARYARINKWQTKLLAIVCALPAHNDALDKLESPWELDLPLTFFCQNRGKVITRNEWTENAFWFTLDARADGFLIGHDTCSRGAFVLNFYGRPWVVIGEWNVFRESQDYSLVHIDGIGQMLKAPMVKFLRCEDSPGSLFASVDLTYAYNWKWSEWAKRGQKMGEGWEIEPHDPRDFGIPQDSWVPNKLFDEPGVGFAGLYQWRKRFNYVEKVMRSALVIRAPVPFLVLADDVKKDEKVHTYQWHLSTSHDLEMESFNGTDVVLREKGEEKRGLLVRVLSTGDHASVRATFEERHKKAGQGKPEVVGRLILSSELTEANFKMLLYPLRHRQAPLPQTFWQDAQTLQLRAPQHQVSYELAFDTGRIGETIIRTYAKSHPHSHDMNHGMSDARPHATHYYHHHELRNFHHHRGHVKQLLETVAHKIPQLSSRFQSLYKK